MKKYIVIFLLIITISNSAHAFVSNRLSAMIAGFLSIITVDVMTEGPATYHGKAPVALIDMPEPPVLGLWHSAAEYPQNGIVCEYERWQAQEYMQQDYLKKRCKKPGIITGMCLNFFEKIGILKDKEDTQEIVAYFNNHVEPLEEGECD